MKLDEKLYAKINEYCGMNGLNTRKYIHELLERAFTADVYGEIPFGSCTKEILQKKSVPETYRTEENPRGDEMVEVPEPVSEAPSASKERIHQQSGTRRRLR